MPRLVAWAVLGVTAALAVTVAFPSVDPVDVVAGLGVVSIAAGFAFQDIFSNLLSGLLLIVRQPFVAGDEIEVAGLEGTVLAITIRETEIRTFEGRHIFIPNRQVYQDAITVQTAGPIVRTELLVGCSYDDDLATAAQCAAAAVGSCSGVLADPAPEAYYVAFNDSAVDLELTWWTDAHQAEQRAVRHRVVTAVHRAFAEEGLTIPWPIRTVDLSNVESGVNAPS
jgi:small-conductance mechanosensitive channel